MSDQSSVRGGVAVVTGGAAGIGEAAVRRLAREGARVALLDRDAGRGAEVVARLKDDGAEALFLEADATSKPQVAAAFREALDAWGRIDILVNCAGGFVHTHPVEEVEEAEWDRIVDLNLKSVFLCTQQAVPPMKRARYGRIVNISSMAGRDGLGETSIPYGAAKAGILGLTRRLAVELAPHGITVNAVAPGLVLSPRVAEMHKGRLPELYAKTPVGRAGEAAEIADAIFFLASPGAAYITGVTLDVNGGRYMT